MPSTCQPRRGAGKVLWNAGKLSSVDEITRLLKNRFRTQNQDERYRAELKGWKRRKGESLQAVHHFGRRLMALAFPRQSVSLMERVARDSFFDALGEPPLRMKVLKREPSTMDEALKIACRLEALGKAGSEESWDEFGRRKDKNHKTMALQTGPDKRTDARITKLEPAVIKYKEELEDTRSEDTSQTVCRAR